MRGVHEVASIREGIGRRERRLTAMLGATEPHYWYLGAAEVVAPRTAASDESKLLWSVSRLNLDRADDQVTYRFPFGYGHWSGFFRQSPFPRSSHR